MEPAYEVGDRVRVVAKRNLGRFPVGHVGVITEVYGEKPTYRIDGERAALYGADELELVT